MNTRRRPVARTHLQQTARSLGILCILGAAEPAPAEALEKTGAPRTVKVPMQGTSLVEGRSTITIDAPLSKVRETVLDFAHYADFMPHYRKCKVLGRTASGGREVYMEVSAVHGIVKMWARVEVAKPATVDGVEIHQTKFIEGNVKDLRATWRLRKIDGSSTEVTLDVFLNPSLPLPDSLVNEQNLSGSADAVLAVRKRITGR